jgi:hypothetical protein
MTGMDEGLYLFVIQNTAKVNATVFQPHKALWLREHTRSDREVGIQNAAQQPTWEG